MTVCRHRPARPPCPGRSPAALRSEADADGRFRVAAPVVRPPSIASASAPPSPDGAPYLIAEKQGEWPKGAVEQSVDLALPRGVVVRGKVTEEGTGRPVAGAVVRIAPYRSPAADRRGLVRPRGDGSGRHLSRRRAAGAGLPGRAGLR